MTPETPGARSPQIATPVVGASAGKLAAWAWRGVALLGFGLYLWACWAVWKLVEPSVPDEITVDLMVRSITVHEIRHKVLDAASLLVALIPFVLYVEAILVGWEKSSVRRILFARTESIKMDLACLAAGQTPVMQAIGKVLTFGLSAGFGVWIHDALSKAVGFDIGLSAMPEIAQVFVYFWLYTFFDYWTHRIDHTYFFWPLHRYHHSTEDFCVITSLRSHPAAFLGVFIINAPMAILGAPISVMISVNLIVTTIGLLIHSGIDSDWGWFGKWVIQSPNHHRLHHILDYKTHGVGNFAIAPIWDHLFGTYKGEAGPSLAIGVDKPLYRQGWFFFIDLFRDYWDFVKTYGLFVVGKRRID